MGVDIGGTFTDVAVVDRDGRLQVGKVLTTPAREHVGVLEAISDSSVRLDQVDILVHGTTLVINALLERRGATVAVVTTAGFRDVVELGRSNRPESYNLFYHRDPALVPRERRLEIRERVLADGTIEEAPTDDEIRALADRVSATDVDAVAVAFLNSYVESGNEDRVADGLRRRLPGVLVTTSSSLSREWREYERFSSAVANAYVAPATDDYLARLEDAFDERGFAGRFVMLDSTGGALHPETARAYPLRLVESGPVGGVLASARLAERLGLDRVVTFDMGGTTAKSALVEAGRFDFADLYWIGGYDRGLPIQIPSADILEIGAGGGSIAWIDEGERLRVGPRSSAASPGPACYGLGGTEPTVTDANVYCGRLSPEHFSGTITIDAGRAAVAIEGLAERAGVPPMRLALGILTLANMSMAEAVRRQTVARGRNPRDLVLVASGGAGPMHACAVAAEVGIRSVVVPQAPGHFSAIGMLNANLRFDHREVFRAPLDRLDAAALTARLQTVAAELADIVLRGAGQDADGLTFRSVLAMRCVGQEHTILIASPWEGLVVPADAAAHLYGSFAREYDQRFGHFDAAAPVEIVELVVIAEQELRPVDVEHLVEDVGAPEATMLSYQLSEEDPLETRVLDRRVLRSGAVVDGPALIYELGANTIVPPLARVVVLAGGELMITLHDDRAQG
jgi:N-methylhydantoinase A